MDTHDLLRDAARLAARATLGGTLAAHGAQKMFGVQGGPGLQGTAAMMKSLGFEPAEKYARAVAMTEITAGSLIALGALGPVGPAMLLSVMIVAVETVHRPKGYWNTNGGYELNAMYTAIAALLANEGYGRFSLDHLAGLEGKLRAGYAWLALAGGAAAAYGILAQRGKGGSEQAKSEQTSPSRNGEPALR